MGPMDQAGCFHDPALLASVPQKPDHVKLGMSCFHVIRLFKGAARMNGWDYAILARITPSS